MNTPWKTNSRLLAGKLVVKIVDSGPITIDQLDARAIKLGIDMNVLDQALQLVHKCKSIERKVLKGTLTYSHKKPVVKSFIKTSSSYWTTVVNKESQYFEAKVVPLAEFETKDTILYREFANMSPGYGTNRVWLCPNDFNLDNKDFSLPEEERVTDHPIFADMNFDYLFLTPEELDRYKCEAKGRVYIPKKRYQRKAKVVTPPTPMQQELISMFKTSV